MVVTEKHGAEISLGINASLSECKAYEPTERLVWTYNSLENVVRLLHSGMEMNCCGRLEVAIVFEEGRYVLHERDDAEDKEYGRCGCICGYDMKIELPDIIAGGRLQIAIAQHVVDSGMPETIVWEGGFDLQLGSGEVCFAGKLTEYPPDK